MKIIALVLYLPSLNTRNTRTKRIARSTASPLPPPLTASSKYHGNTATTSTWFIGRFIHAQTPRQYDSSPFMGPHWGCDATLHAISSVNSAMHTVSVVLNRSDTDLRLAHSGTVSKMNPTVAMKMRTTTA